MDKRKKRFRKTLVILACIVCCLIFLSIWNAIITRNENTAYPPEGQIVEINGHKMHVYTTGERQTDKPVIVMISGLGTPSPTADFYPLWSKLNNEYMVVVLERPGYGWSEETDSPRTLTNIVSEDHQALEMLGIEPPYLLVAHSLGGIEAHLFTGTYPDDVSGLLFIDAMSPELYLHYGEAPTPILTKLTPGLRFTGLLRLTDTLFPSVIQKLSQNGRNNLQLLDEHYTNLDRIMTLDIANGKNVDEETKRRVSNAALANEVVLPEQLPAILVVPQLEESKDMQGFEEYLEIQSGWMEQSSKGRLVDGGESGHYMHQYVPDLLIELIRELAGETD